MTLNAMCAEVKCFLFETQHTPTPNNPFRVWWSRHIDRGSLQISKHFPPRSCAFCPLFQEKLYFRKNFVWKNRRKSTKKNKQKIKRKSAWFFQLAIKIHFFIFM